MKEEMLAQMGKIMKGAIGSRRKKVKPKEKKEAKKSSPKETGEDEDGEEC